MSINHLRSYIQYKFFDSNVTISPISVTMSKLASRVVRYHIFEAVECELEWLGQATGSVDCLHKQRSKQKRMPVAMPLLSDTGEQRN